MPSDATPAVRVHEIIRFGMQIVQHLDLTRVGHRPDASSRVTTRRDEILLKRIEAERENGRLMTGEFGRLECLQVDELHLKVSRAAHELITRLVERHACDGQCEGRDHAEEFARFEVVAFHLVLIVRYVDAVVAVG